MKSLKIIMQGLLFMASCHSVCVASSRKVVNPTEDSILLNIALTTFLHSVDSGKVEAVISFYDSGFVSIRVVDQGPLIKMDRQQMINFWKMVTGKKPAGTPGINYKAITVEKTTVHFTEIIGDMAYVLLTRIKDLGSGPEPMFYNLVWKKRGNNWFLFREIVHQRTLPRMNQ
jgi:hypothetical protein